jgi:aryl-alcohol dehydrogenase
VQIRAAVSRAVDRPMAIETLELDEPRADEVLVRIVASGICHTDLFAPRRCALPAVFGHEGAGIVEAVGERVGKVRPGDRVVMTFGSCGHCRNCESGSPAYCEHGHHLQFGGTRADGGTTLRDRDGAAVHGSFFQQSSFATHALGTERNVVKLPDALPFELAAPLGCGIQTGVGAVLNNLAAVAGSTIAIFGVGSVGLAAVMAARLAGCAQIFAIDVSPERLALAAEFGATHALDAREGGVVARIKERVPRGLMYSLETAGQVTTLNDAIECLARRGVCGIVTVPKLGATFPWSPLPLLQGGRSLVSILEGDSVPHVFIPRLADLVLRGQLPIERIIRHYEFDDIATALDDAHHARAIKPVLRMAQI